MACASTRMPCRHRVLGLGDAAHGRARDSGENQADTMTSTVSTPIAPNRAALFIASALPKVNPWSWLSQCPRPTVRTASDPRCLSSNKSTCRHQLI